MTSHAYPSAPPLPSPTAGLQGLAGAGAGGNGFRASGATPAVAHKRKVRCDLGSVEAPSSPPCVRCRRESKECFFSATRRRGPGELAEVDEDEGPSRKKLKEAPVKAKKVVGPAVLPTTLPTRPGHTRAQSASTVSGSGEFVSRPHQRPGGRNGSSDPQSYFEGQEQGDGNIDPSLAGQQLEDRVQAVTSEASTLLSAGVYNTPDALALLFEAVGRSAHISPANATATSASSGAPRRSFDRKNSSASATAVSPTVADSGTMRPPPPKSNTSSCDSRGVRFQDGSVSPRVNRNHINNLSIHSKRNRRLTGRELSPSRSRVLLADENDVPESILDPALVDNVDDSASEGNPLESIGEDAGSPVDVKSPTSPRSANPSATSSKTNTDDPLRLFLPADIASSLRAWKKYRLVNAGWLTPREALLFMTYFYNHMAPMSPIFTGYFSHPSTHEELVMTEPVLATTLLTLASRYCLLPGPGGLSRSYAIHDKLWRNLQSLFQRLMWGSEKGMRTMGTVLALVALTEWHCRGLHFPGEDDGEYTGLGAFGFPDEKAETVDDGDSSTANKYVVEGLGDSIGNLLEPAYRSDRMSWMLLGNSLALAYELGVFDENDDDSSVRPIGGVENSHPSASKLVARPSTATVQRILVISVMHLASRLGWTSMIPRHISVTVLFRGKQRSPFLQQQLQNGSQDPVDVDEPPSLTATPVQDLVLQSWVELTSLMKSASELLFPSRKATKDVLQTGRYSQLLEHFQPLLTAWRRDFDNLTIDEPMRSIMRVEFEYLRLYVNSLALQAVVDRCTNTNLNPNNLNGNSRKAARDATAPPIDLNSNPTITPATFVAPPPVMASMASHPGYATLMQMCAGDEEYIKEVVDASRCLLLTVVRKLLPGGWLKHAPVRTYLRIASAAMYLLKTFALGAREDDIKVSMKLMDQTVYALRAASCDDVHLALRFADLLETLTARIRSRFVRMNQSGKDTPNRLNHGEGANADQPMVDAQPHGSGGAANGTDAGMTPANVVYGSNGYSGEHNGSFPNGFNGVGGQVPGQFPPAYPGVFPTSFHALGDNGNFTNLANMYGIGDHEMDGLFGGTNTGGDDWLTLPIEPLLGYGAGVSSGMMGPDVGGQDMLELLLAEES
ncbi:Transcriptional activator [Drechslerella dactyloides]|uniref:Transcriptional activator n=1 Tax=Drechslerella dactyloides TaxID=74499 RepID=A0AAD6NML2_DREDA|nr:Transcriptional activator [Drechslerella dactyloides]